MIKARLGVSAVLSILYAGLAGADTWTTTGDLNVARMFHRAVLLADGRVLVSGGYCPTCGNNTYDNPTAEVYDPSTGSWSTTGSMNKGRTDHTATLLADGRVLVAVGVNANICTNDTTAELYDPTTSVWSYTGSLPLARSAATATTLVDGRVLLAGGGNRCGGVYSQASLYDPSSGNWTSTGSMTIGREYASAVRLNDGRVLVAGGVSPGGGGFPPVTSAEIYDPTSETWSATGSMTVARSGRGWYLTLLNDGRVLAVSGSVDPLAEVYDPGSETWTSTGSINPGRTEMTLARLGDGRVLAAGGAPGGNTNTPDDVVEIWDPGAETWSTTTSMTTARFAHSSTLLPNGQVLVAGGRTTGAEILSSAELFSSPQAVPSASTWSLTGLAVLMLLAVTGAAVRWRSLGH